MGILGAQSERTCFRVSHGTLRDKIEECIAFSEEYNLDVSVVAQIFLGLTQEVSLEAYRENGDYADEHMAGLADVFREQTDKLFELLESLVPKQD